MSRSWSCPPHAGVSLKPEHFRPALEARTDGLWFEVHPENYMGDGGPRLAWLTAIREHHPLSLHGVGLSLGGPGPLDRDHLARWKRLVDRFDPVRVSEHLAWSSLNGQYFNDLLPTPMTQTALDRFCDHVDEMQTVLQRRVLVENPSRYLPMDEDIPEPEFLAETVKRTGCGLLLDVNNIHVSANNLGFDPGAYLDAIPADAVGEIHLAGHDADPELGEALLIDTHGQPVPDNVWSLFDAAIERVGATPTLIERDTDIPDFETLMSERERAERTLCRARADEPVHA